MIEVKSVTKKYGDTIANKNISLEIKEGEIVGLVGPNGSGKTTLMKIISGIIRKFEGDLVIDGQDMHHFVNKEFKKILGLVIEEPQLILNMTGLANLKYFYDFYKGSQTTKFENEISEIIENLEMQDFIEKKVKNYSLGMKQRLGIGIALVSSPKYLILDEPTNGMDRDSTERILKYLKTLSLNGTGILVSSHILEDISSSCNHVYALKKGELTHDIYFDENEHIGKNQILLDFNLTTDFESFLKNKFIEVIYQGKNQILIKDSSKSLHEISKLREQGIEFSIGQKSKMDLFYEDIFGDNRHEI